MMTITVLRLLLRGAMYMEQKICRRENDQPFPLVDYHDSVREKKTL